MITAAPSAGAPEMARASPPPVTLELEHPRNIQLTAINMGAYSNDLLSLIRLESEGQAVTNAALPITHE